MVDSGFDRAAIAEEMRDAATTFHRLLASANSADLRRRSNGTRWNNEQLLFHMLFGYMIVRALLVLVRVLGRLPPSISKGFARMLNLATRPFNTINYWGSRLGGHAYGHRRMGPKLDRVITGLQRRLQRERESDLARAMSYPTRWDPFFTPKMTLADVYHFPTQHFEFHRRQLTLGA